MAKPTFKQILDALKNQVLVGKSYLDLAKGLLQADPAVLQIAPTFFGLTANGSLELAQMTVARLYDTTSGAVTVQVMLLRAAREVGSFQRNQQDVNSAISKAQKVVTGLEPVLDAIRQRRNEWLAHLDPRTVANPKALSAKAKLTMPDL
jgi:hypothetical protein